MNKLLHNYVFWIIAAFALVFAFSHRFAYVEGDDATSIAYHLLGRDASLQPPYGAYNGMMDKLLGLLPPSEPVLRLAAFGISSLAAVVFVLLALKLVFDWLGQVSPVQRVSIALLTLAACPELFFLGMAYTPGLVAMCFMLGAHLALRHALRPGATAGGHRPAWGWFLASVALFGFGASCRWETLTYGIVPVMDLWVGFSAHRLHRPSLRQIAFGIVWGALALIAAFAFIGVSGYGPKAMIDFVKLSQKASSGELRAGTAYGLRNVIGIYQPFFTPAFLLLLLVGIFSALMKSRALLVKGLIGLLPLLPMLYNGAPKLLLAAFPGLALLVAMGIEKLWFALRSGPRLHVARAALALVVLAPWLIGIRIFSPDTQWGPGFEVRTASVESLSPDAAAGKPRTIGIAKVAPALGAGFAFSTPEGPRPFGGFGAVLLGGGWRIHLGEREAERRKVIEQALATKQPILQDDGNAMVLIHLLAQGLTTRDRAPKALLKPGETAPWDENGLCRRTFSSGDGRLVTMLQLKGNSLLFKPDQLDKLVLGANLGPVILHSGYSSTLAKLFKISPQSAQPLGPFSATVNLGLLQQSIRAQTAAATGSKTKS